MLSPQPASPAARADTRRPALDRRHSAGEVIRARCTECEGNVDQERDADQRLEVSLMRVRVHWVGEEHQRVYRALHNAAPTCMSPPSGPLLGRSTWSEGQARSTAAALDPVPSRV